MLKSHSIGSSILCSPHITHYPSPGSCQASRQNTAPALAPGPIVYFLLHLSWLEQTYTWNYGYLIKISEAFCHHVINVINVIH